MKIKQYFLENRLFQNINKTVNETVWQNNCPKHFLIKRSILLSQFTKSLQVETFPVLVRIKTFLLNKTKKETDIF